MFWPKVLAERVLAFNFWLKTRAPIQLGFIPFLRVYTNYIGFRSKILAESFDRVLAESFDRVKVLAESFGRKFWLLLLSARPYTIGIYFFLRV